MVTDGEDQRLHRPDRPQRPDRARPTTSRHSPNCPSLATARTWIATFSGWPRTGTWASTRPERPTRVTAPRVASRPGTGLQIPSPNSGSFTVDAQAAIRTRQLKESAPSSKRGNPSGRENDGAAGVIVYSLSVIARQSEQPCVREDVLSAGCESPPHGAIPCEAESNCVVQLSRGRGLRLCGGRRGGEQQEANA